MSVHRRLRLLAFPTRSGRRKRLRMAKRSPGFRARSLSTCQGLRPRRAGPSSRLSRRSVWPSDTGTSSAPGAFHRQSGKETAMAISTWWWDGHGHGSNPVAFPFGTNIINRHSRVVCSMCEIAQPPGEALDYPFIGGASMQILNVAPDDTGTVHVWVSVNWGSDLNCCFSSIHRLHYSTFRHST